MSGFGSRTVAEYDVGFNIDLGKVTGELGAVGETFARTTGQMSNDAIRLSVAQDKLTRAIARSGPESTAAKAALLNYRRELESLQHTQTGNATAAGRHTSALKTEERELSHASRGALAASGVFRGLGRAVAFSSSAFLGGAGLIFAIKEATKVAADQQTAEAQLETALKNRGIAVDDVRGKVNALAAANAQLGFGELDTTKSLTLAVTATGSLEGATRLLSVAQNVARARGTDLNDATLLLTRAFEGSGRGLKALGVEVAKGAKGFEALDAVQAKYAGRAVAYAEGPRGAYARLNAELERTKVTIGTELLPVELRIANAVSDWLGKTKNQQKIQHDLNAVLKTGGSIVHDFSTALGIVRSVLGPVSKLLGGTTRTVELLGGALVALKVRAIAADMGLLATNTARAGAAAAISAGEYNALAGAEGRAAGAGLAGGRGFFSIPNVGVPGSGTRGVVGRINAYTATGAGATATAGLGLGILGSIALGSFGSQSDLRKVPKLYIDDVSHGGYLGDPVAPGSVTTINGERYLVTVKNGDYYLYSRDYLVARQPGKGSPGGGHGIKSGPILNPGPPSGANPLSRSATVSLAVQRAQVAVARGDKGAQQQLVAALKQQIDLDRDNEKLQERLVRTDVKNRKQHLAELQSLYADEQSSLDQIASLEQKNEVAKTAKVKSRADVKKKAERERDALIRQLSRGQFSFRSPTRYPGESDAEYALAARSAALEKVYSDKIKQAVAKDKTTAKKTAAAAAGPTAALARELQDAVAGLAQYAPNIQAALGTNVTVNQHFPHMPTPDYSREAIYARHALQAQFD